MSYKARFKFVDIGESTVAWLFGHKKLLFKLKIFTELPDHFRTPFDLFPHP